MHPLPASIKALIGISVSGLIVATVLVILWVKEARVFSMPLTGYFMATDPNPGYLDKTKYFPNHVVLESNWKIIQDEYIEYMNKDGSLVSMFDADKINATVFGKNSKAWKILVLKHTGGWLEENCKDFPKTVALLKDFPEISRIMFSVFEPRSFLKPHRAFSKTILRF